MTFNEADVNREADGKFGEKTGAAPEFTLSPAKDKDGTPIIVGTPATVYIGSDRSPATVVNVSKSGRTVEIQADKFQRVDDNGFSESQEYTYAPNPDGPIHKYSLRKDGRYRRVGTDFGGISFGERNAYRDPSF